MNTMRVLAIVPPVSKRTPVYYFPIGLGIVTAILKNEGHEVRVADLLNTKDGNDIIDSGSYDAVFMGGFSTQLKGMREIIKRIKKANPSAKIVIGGTGVQTIPKEAFAYLEPDILSVVEAEINVKQIIQALQSERNFKDIDGIYFRDGDEIVNTNTSFVFKELDESPRPAYECFDISVISKKSYDKNLNARSLHIITSRGCPFSCNFCINSAESYKCRHILRFRSPANVVDEIRFLRDRYNVKDFMFADEEFIINKQRALDLCAALKDLKITFSTSIRGDSISEGVAAALREAGCYRVYIGIENIDRSISQRMNKRLSADAVCAGLKILKRHHIQAYALFMMGYYGETKESIKANVDFAKKNGVLYIASFYTIFPGSKDFDDYRNKIFDWSDYFERLAMTNFTVRPIMNVTGMSDIKLVYFRNKAFIETLIYKITYSNLLSAALSPFGAALIFLYHQSPLFIQRKIRELMISWQ